MRMDYWATCGTNDDWVSYGRGCGEGRATVEGAKLDCRAFIWNANLLLLSPFGDTLWC